MATLEEQSVDIGTIGQSESMMLVQAGGLDSPDELDLADVNAFREKESNSRNRGDQRRTKVGAVGMLGGFLLGYDFGVISAALLQLMTEFNLNCFTKQLLVSSALFGAFGGSLFGGNMLDLIGRRATLLINALIYTIGTGLVVGSPALWMLIWGRVTTGLALAISSSGECVYISEMIDPDNRGKLVSLREMGVPMGYLFSNIIGFLLIQVPNGWRYMFAIPLLALLVQFGILYSLNESERYIVSVGNPQDPLSWRKIKENEGNIIGRGILGFMLVLFQQLTGQVNILYYTPYVLHAMGVTSIRFDVLISSTIGVVKAVATLVALLVVDSIGRRKLLTIGPVVMVAGAVLMSSAMLFDPTPRSHDELRCGFHAHKSNLSQQNNATDTLNQISSEAMRTAILYLVGAIIYIGAFSISFAPVVWIILTEIYPTNFRGRAISYASAVNWLTNWLISFTFLYALDSMGASTTFGLYGLVCVMAGIFVYFFLPETRGKTLEEISENFSLGPKHGGEKTRLLQGLRST